MNTQIKKQQNHIITLQKQLNILNEKATKRLDFLATQDGPYSILSGQILQLTQRISDNENALEVMKEMIGEPSEIKL